MKNASIFHGTGESPKHFWFPWLKSELEKKGYNVWLPELPDAESPEIKTWLAYALKNGTFNSETVLVGHSAGCPLILSILENLDIQIKQAILTAAFFEKLPKIKVEPILQDSYNWPKIKSNSKKITIINSDNDPWNCDDKVGQKLAGFLGAKLIIRHDGHFGSATYNQPYKQFPLLLTLL